MLGEDLFIVTKLPPSGNRPDGVNKYLKRSLEDLQLDYVDLYLVHVPFAFKEVEGNLHPTTADGKVDLDVTTDIIAVWKVSRCEFIERLTSGYMNAEGIIKNSKEVGYCEFSQLLFFTRIRIPPMYVYVN